MNEIPKAYKSRDPVQAAGHLIEECGELSEAISRLVMAAGKTVRFGPTSVNPELPLDEQEKNIDWLFREAADVERAIQRFKEFFE